MSYVLGHLLAAAGLALLVYLAGLIAERSAFRHAGLDPGLRTASRWLLGIAFWVITAFALASLGLLSRVALVVVAASVTLAAGTVLVSGLRAHDLRLRAPRSRPLDLACGLVASGLLVPIFLLAVGPTVSWDAGVYHLTLPLRMLETGAFADVPALVYAHWPLATELLYAVAMGFGSYVTAKLLHFGLGLLVLVTLASAVRRSVGRRGASGAAAAAGWLAVGLVLANDVAAFELRVAYVEWLHAFALLIAVLLLSAARDAVANRDAEVRASLQLAGLACGLMAAVKLTGILWVPVAAAIYLPALAAARREGRGAAAVARFVLAFGLPVAALALPWPVKAWWSTGNPFYPFAWEIFGGPWWSAELGEQLAAWQRGIGMGRSPLDHLLLPWRVITDGGPGYARFDGRLSTLWLAALPLAALGGWRVPLARRALFVAGGCFALWAVSSQQMRLLLPILPLLALAAGIGFSVAVEPLRNVSLRRALAAAVAVATLLAATAAHARILGAGYRRLALYAAQPSSALYARAAPPVFAAIDRLPDDARILMLGTNHGFFCRRDYLADSFFEASQLADWLRDVGDDSDALDRRLAEQRISHLLVTMRPRPIDWPPALLRLLGDASRAETVHADPEHRLVALSGAGSRDPS